MDPDELIEHLTSIRSRYPNKDGLDVCIFIGYYDVKRCRWSDS